MKMASAQSYQAGVTLTPYRAIFFCYSFDKGSLEPEIVSAISVKCQMFIVTGQGRMVWRNDNR